MNESIGFLENLTLEQYDTIFKMLIRNKTLEEMKSYLNYQ